MKCVTWCVADAQAIAMETWTLRQLLPRIDRQEDCIKFLAERRLLANAVVCRVCGQPASLINTGDHADGKRWSCRGCGWRQAVRYGSFFAGSHLSLWQITVCMYMWAHDEPQDRIMREAGITKWATIIDWCNFFEISVRTKLRMSE